MEGQGRGIKEGYTLTHCSFTKLECFPSVIQKNNSLRGDPAKWTCIDHIIAKKHLFMANDKKPLGPNYLKVKTN